ncbi:hypothetical protein DFA_04977 [Cavenderia fasciculata]|uniref:Uncharacterized protein n=1 Tax=Cavenderia fasciculata TaxID=261658 RepID=F4PMQ0_CACFS|nr:uncharacterized protein DFA_04977 [Cavenderia fasciculata]EGG22847.1 hypothetical protein DFA_04977 [Cavenderia fasciculata]|eukprot:XP_004360698.1 hypothetical protein DFA_04977 [Cavenderia fasciculata]
MNNKADINNLFKSLLHSSYIRTKIFNHVEIIHQRIISSDLLVLKSNQIVSLCECIKVNRSDLFIKHFDSVYQSMLSYSNEKEFSFNNKTFKQILNTIFQYDGHVELDYLLQRFGRIKMTVLRDGFIKPPINVFRLLIQHNYHLPEKNDNETDHAIFVDVLTRLAVFNGELEMFDRIFNDYFDHNSDKFSFYVDKRSFKGLINKLNNQQHTTNNNNNNNNNGDNNNQSKYYVIFYMVKKLLSFGVDLRSLLFIDALECDNNQEIIKWIRDSFDSKEQGNGTVEDFNQLFQHYLLFPIEKYATTNTLKLIEFNQLVSSSNRLSTRAAQFGNLDFLSYMYDMKQYQYLFEKTQLHDSLSGPHLECANFLMTIAVKEGYTKLQCWSIDPSIMSLDLVKRLVEIQCQMMSFSGLIESAIKSNQPETLEFILSLLKDENMEFFDSDEKFVIMSLALDDPVITEMLLDRFFSSEDRPPKTFTVEYIDKKICYAPLLSLFNKGHSIEFNPLEYYTSNPSIVSQKVVQLCLEHLSIERVPPWVILVSVNHPDFNDQGDYKLLKDTLSLINQYPEEDMQELQHDVLNEACRMGLVKVVECFGDWAWKFGDSLFRTAMEYKQTQMALFLGQAITTHFKEMDTNRLELILNYFYFIDDDQDFEMIWDVLQPLTSNSSYVSRAITYSRFKFSKRSSKTKTIDRFIKHYTRYYNSPEKDQFKMTPIRITNRDQSFDPFNIHHLYTNYRDCPVIDFSDFNVDKYYIQNNELGVIPFNK